MTDQTWNELLREQLSWHWDTQLRPRLDGLTDAEYFREPVPGCWNVRPRGTGTAPIQGGAGAMTVDFAYPAPEPAPFTTIAWRLAHVVVGGLAMRNAAHFGRTPTDYLSFDYAPTAAGALAQLDAEYAAWQAGVESLGDAGLTRACGDAEGPFAGRPLGSLVLNINRELIHHLAEVCLLRDLYLHTDRSKEN
ncbi:DinB family protein [Nocardia stercoris]|uniref:DinB family protein n=1 Tax=Nocardia stercoris TaxID=2483361 RepID=A0A3M2LH10_9NOCA|nr:DinB family protein [Nocardia stercoris]RMI34048.1 DinB family protein [Nocardia stercoris]